jgi:hypothetical protein
LVEKKHHHHHHHNKGGLVVNVVGVPAPTKSVTHKAKKPKLIHKTVFAKKKNDAQTSSAIGGLVSMVIGAVVGAWFTL